MPGGPNPVPAAGPVSGCAPAAALLVVLGGLILATFWIVGPTGETTPATPTPTVAPTPTTGLATPRVVASPTHDAWCALVGQSCWYGENWGKP